jgi:UDP-2,3-diacylglucosamine hydrolase
MTMNSLPFSYIISDLHLTPERPRVTAAFLEFLGNQAEQAERLYILGDLFEYWIGDDAASLVGAEPILHAMKQASRQLPCFFIAGNRDFLVGPEFSRHSGFEILADESIVDLYGIPTLLLHGDSLCTDDVAHQQFRSAMVTNAPWREEFLQLSIPERIAAAQQARMQSHQHKSEISMEIMDVTEKAVIDCFTKTQVSQMIHGHTHRQNTHQYKLRDQTLSRYVLGDWGATSSIMKVDSSGISIDNKAI